MQGPSCRLKQKQGKRRGERSIRKAQSRIGTPFKVQQELATSCKDTQKADHTSNTTTTTKTPGINVTQRIGAAKSETSPAKTATGSWSSPIRAAWLFLPTTSSGPIDNLKKDKSKIAYPFRPCKKGITWKLTVSQKTPKEHKKVTTPTLDLDLEPMTWPFVATEIKNKRLVGLKGETVEDSLRENEVQAKYLCRKS